MPVEESGKGCQVQPTPNTNPSEAVRPAEPPVQVQGPRVGWETQQRNLPWAELSRYAGQQGVFLRPQRHPKHVCFGLRLGLGEEA